MSSAEKAQLFSNLLSLNRRAIAKKMPYYATIQPTTVK
jgi:hypothetical protein